MKKRFLRTWCRLLRAISGTPRSLAFFLLILVSGFSSLPANAQTTGLNEDSRLVTLSTGEKVLEWYGKLGRTYFIQVSDTNTPLQKWSWAPMIESGHNEPISHQVNATAEIGFFRLQYTDQPIPPELTPDTADFDGDGISNIDEITGYTLLGTTLQIQTNPLDSDTDHDGLTDKFERDHNLDATDDGSIDPNNGPNGDPDGDGLTNAEEQAIGTDPTNPDTDGDEVPDGDEVTNKTDPNDSEDTAVADWFVLIGDSAEGVVKTEIRTFTIKKGDSRVLIIGSTSAEYSYYTGKESEFDDTLFWEIDLPEGTPISETVHVNDRHVDWEADSINGVTLQEFSPVHIEKVKVVHASESSDATVTVTLKATNISDGDLPSTLIVGLLPVRISPEDGMVGVVGDKVSSNKGEGGEKHFVTPKKSTEIADEFVKLRAKGLEDAWLTPGDPNQLLEWDPAVGESNGGIRKWKVKREATGKYPVKIRTIAKYDNEEAAKRNVWVVWATCTSMNGVANFNRYTGYARYEVLPTDPTWWRFKFKIEPASICDPTNPERPDLTGEDLADPPGFGNTYSVDPSLGAADTATAKWDVSRQSQTTIRNPNSIPKNDLLQGGFSQAWAVNQPKAVDIPVPFPASDVEGNDDPLAPPGIDEDVNPYRAIHGGSVLNHDIGELSSIDAPAAGIVDWWGATGMTIAVENNFREFARLELWDGSRTGGKFWFRISDHLLWHHYLKSKFNSTSLKWEDNSSSSGLGNPTP